MDNALSQILEMFKHLVRDILVYLVSGLLVLANLLFIDHTYLEKSTLNFLTGISYLPIIVIITSYGIGQLIMAIMFLIVEQTGFERFITSKMKINPNLNLEGELKIFVL
jgi:hypothetical protein